MIVYHGSNKLFESFDYKTIGMHGTSRGAGFYFTDDKELAEFYAKKWEGEGYLYTVEFSGIKSLSNNRRTLHTQEWKTLFLQLMDNDNFASNYDYNVNYAVECECIGPDSDVDILMSICHGMGGYKIPLTELYRLLGYDSIVYNENGYTFPMGFDSIKLQHYLRKIFVALVTDVIQITDVQKV